jgi:hypothetical protein
LLSLLLKKRFNRAKIIKRKRYGEGCQGGGYARAVVIPMGEFSAAGFDQ